MPKKTPKTPKTPKTYNFKVTCQDTYTCSYDGKVLIITDEEGADVRYVYVQGLTNAQVRAVADAVVRTVNWAYGVGRRAGYAACQADLRRVIGSASDA